MRYPECKSTQTRCVDSRQRDDTRERRYRCLKCGERFRTVEQVFGHEVAAPGGIDSVCYACILAKAAEVWNSQQREDGDIYG